MAKPKSSTRPSSPIASLIAAIGKDGRKAAREIAEEIMVHAPIDEDHAAQYMLAASGDLRTALLTYGDITAHDVTRALLITPEGQAVLRQPDFLDSLCSDIKGKEKQQTAIEKLAHALEEDPHGQIILAEKNGALALAIIKKNPDTRILIAKALRQTETGRLVLAHHQDDFGRKALRTPTIEQLLEDAVKAAHQNMPHHARGPQIVSTDMLDAQNAVATAELLGESMEGQQRLCAENGRLALKLMALSYPAARPVARALALHPDGQALIAGQSLIESLTIAQLPKFLEGLSEMPNHEGARLLAADNGKIARMIFEKNGDLLEPSYWQQTSAPLLGRLLASTEAGRKVLTDDKEFSKDLLRGGADIPAPSSNEIPSTVADVPLLHIKKTSIANAKTHQTSCAGSPGLGSRAG